MRNHLTLYIAGKDRAGFEAHLRALYPEDWYRRRSQFARQAIAEKIARDRKGGD